VSYCQTHCSCRWAIEAPLPMAVTQKKKRRRAPPELQQHHMLPPEATTAPRLASLCGRRGWPLRRGLWVGGSFFLKCAAGPEGSPLVRIVGPQTRRDREPRKARRGRMWEPIYELRRAGIYDRDGGVMNFVERATLIPEIYITWGKICVGKF
jgi:hypothetical protein